MFGNYDDVYSKDDVMAEVVSSNGQVGWTVIMLNDDETKALTDLLELLNQHPTLNEDFPALDELTNTMIGASDD